MSYVRFGEADVYVYADIGGYLCCCGCTLGTPSDYHSTDALIAHLREHQAQGDNVPDFVFDDLLADKEENDTWIAACEDDRPYLRAPSNRFQRDLSSALENADGAEHEILQTFKDGLGNGR